MKTKIIMILAIAVVAFTSCNPIIDLDGNGYESILIHENRHLSTNGIRAIDKSRPMYSWYFTEDTKYILYPDSAVQWRGDQKDWNKLVGHTWNLIDPHVNTAMVGWRYNPSTDLFELNAYYHVGGDRRFTPPLIYVEAGTKFQTWIRETGFSVEGNIIITVSIRTEDGQSFDHSEEFTKSSLPSITRKIAWYFGGNRKSPHLIEMFRLEIFSWN